MADSDLSLQCPVWGIPCIKEKCTSYETHTKQRFFNKQSQKFIPMDQIVYFLAMTPEQMKATIERQVTIVKECKQLGKIIEIETLTDNLIPDFS